MLSLLDWIASDNCPDWPFLDLGDRQRQLVMYSLSSEIHLTPTLTLEACLGIHAKRWRGVHLRVTLRLRETLERLTHTFHYRVRTQQLQRQTAGIHTSLQAMEYSISSASLASTVTRLLKMSLICSRS